MIQRCGAWRLSGPGAAKSSGQTAAECDDLANSALCYFLPVIGYEFDAQPGHRETQRQDILIQHLGRIEQEFGQSSRLRTAKPDSNLRVGEHAHAGFRIFPEERVAPR